MISSRYKTSMVVGLCNTISAIFSKNGDCLQSSKQAEKNILEFIEQILILL